MTSQPRPPVGLGTRGRRLWRRILASYALSDAELEVLGEAARTADQLEALRAASKDAPMVPGSRGQWRVSPAVQEARLQADLLGRLLARLDLPGEDEITGAAAVMSKVGNTSRWYGRRSR